MKKRYLIGLLGIFALASCGKSEYVVTLSSNNQTEEVKTNRIESDTLPNATLYGYTFEGWYYDLAYTNKVNVGDKIKSNVTIYAKFVEKAKHTITFNVGTKGTPIDSAQAFSCDNLPTPVSQEGFSFLGWFYDNEYKNPVNKNDEVASDITIYAKWSNVASGGAYSDGESWGQLH